MSDMTLGPIGEKFLESRGLDPELAVRFGWHTAKRAGHETVPSRSGEVLAVPFWDGDAVVATKYRTPDKKFWQAPGGRSSFWNVDALRDPAFEQGRMPVVITEGELDALTAIQCGFPLTVSVPDGAPPPSAEQLPATATADAEGKFKFCWHAANLLVGPGKRFVLAVDNDPPGQRLAAELVRRLFAARCSFVEYPAGCKDLNDVLQRHGPEAVAGVINTARPYPVRGLYRISDYPERGALQTFSTGWPTLDQHFRMFTGEFCVITGIPSHGKSTFVLNLLVNLAKVYGWRSAIFSPEMPAVPFIRNRLRSLYGEYRDPVAVSSFIEDRFVFIDAEPSGDQDEEFTLDWVLSKANEAVMRDGIRCLVIDPWNELEHARGRNESVTEYTGRSIRELKRFARLRDIAIIVVAHPTKDVWREGKSRVPTLYDIEGSAHWFNKADHGLIVERCADLPDLTNIHIAKARFQETGERGAVKMRFNRHVGRFEMLDDAEQKEAAE